MAAQCVRLLTLISRAGTIVAMGRIISEVEIAALLVEPKPLPSTWPDCWNFRRCRDTADNGYSFEVAGANGSTFEVIARQAKHNIDDFSIIVRVIGFLGHDYTLLRLDGPHLSSHWNRLDPASVPFVRVCHIHRITVLYQQAPQFRPEHHADTTSAYDSLPNALRFLAGAYGFYQPAPDPGGATLFEGGTP